MVALLMMCATGAGAETPPIYPGNATCRQWTTGADGVEAAKRATQDTAYNLWIAGFFDASAVQNRTEVPTAPERVALITAMFKFCGSSPDVGLANAAIATFFAYRATK